jgi:hypothetical protein
VGGGHRAYAIIPGRAASATEDLSSSRSIPASRTDPGSGIEHVALALGVEDEIRLLYSDSTLYRHHSSVLERLHITAWGPGARELARRTMIDIAQTRTDPADLVNAAVDALVRHRFELPSLNTFDSPCRTGSQPGQCSAMATHRHASKGG